ncbi:hypothetical protein MMC20_003751 [Loxospora ochrophaea]|nr:hypothetical protein [Loxospora ochrophaea]
MLILSFLVLLGFCTLFASAQSDTSNETAEAGYFTFPNPNIVDDQNLVFQVGDTVNITWNTTYAIDLSFLDADAQDEITFDQGDLGSSYSWIVNVNNSNGTSPYFWFVLENSDNSSQYAYSAQFRVDEPLDVSASSKLATSTIKPTTTPHATSAVYITKLVTQVPTTSTSTGPSSISATTTSAPTQTSSGLSTGAKAGIGVGVPVGVIAIGGLGFIAFLYRRRMRKQSTPDTTDVPDARDATGTGDYPAEAPTEPPAEKRGIFPPDLAEMQGQNEAPVELDAATAPVEAPGLAPRHELDNTQQDSYETDGLMNGREHRSGSVSPSSPSSPR